MIRSRLICLWHGWWRTPTPLERYWGKLLMASATNCSISAPMAQLRDWVRRRPD